MIEYYTEPVVLVRQIANGAMTISAAFIIAIFIKFIWYSWPYRKENVAVRAAIAILILTCGHIIRSVSSWMEFIWIDLDWKTTSWMVQSWSWFILSAILVLIGKALMILNFAPWKYRKMLAVAAVGSAIIIPTAIALLII